MFKPLIAIPAYINQENSPDTYGVNKSCVDAVIAAGGCPVLLPISLPNEELSRIFDKLDGLLLTGGGDVSPQLYGQEPTRNYGAIDLARDRADSALFYRAYEKGTPVLGICRGCQVINVALGGTLIQDISSAIPNSLCHNQVSANYEKHHTIKLTNDSLLLQIFGKQDVMVNSFHHQSIDKLGDGLKITAHSADGVVEAIEGVERDRYLHAVQFHPEWMRDMYPEFNDIFAEFIVSCQCQR